MNRTTLAIGILLGLVLALVTGRAEAGTKTLKCKASGAYVDVPIDPDSDSCFVAQNGATVCTDYSSHSNYSRFCSPGGRGTGQRLAEFDPVPGSGCNIAGTVVPGIASSTCADLRTHGCALNAVDGSDIWQQTSTGDLTFSTVSETNCTDLSSGPPFNFTGSFEEPIIGGTGTNAGATGTRSGTYRGQTLTLDAALHGAGWFEVNWTETITTP